MKRLILIISVIAATLFSSSCTKFLDTVPDNRTEIDDAEKVYKLLANAYPRKTFAGMLEARCDGMNDFGTLYGGGQQSESFEFMRAGFYWMPQVNVDCDDSYERFWEDCYRAIAYCNFALEAIDEYGKSWDAETVKQLTAEARISRAYHHFLVVSLYTNMFSEREHNTKDGGIPYVTKPEDNVYKQYERGTIARTLTAIRKDLFEEIDNIGGSSIHKVPKFRFSRDAAYAFAVRFSLFTGDYDNVILYADKLLPNATKYQSTGKNDIDGEPQIIVDNTDKAYESLKSTLLNMQKYRELGTDLYQPGVYFTDPSNSSYLLSTEVETVVMRTFLGTLMSSYAYDKNTIIAIAGNNVTGGSWAFPVLEFANDQTAFIIKHYEDMLLVNESAGIGYVYCKINLFRLEEVLLSRAEAKALLGDFQGALDDMNMYASAKLYNYDYDKHKLTKNKVVEYYRTNGLEVDDIFVNDEVNKAAFAGFTNEREEIAKAIVLAIMDFRRAEFIFEGMRYFDILRWNMKITHFRTSDNTRHTLWPTDHNRILQLPTAAALNGMPLNPMEKIREPWPGILYE